MRVRAQLHLVLVAALGRAASLPGPHWRIASLSSNENSILVTPRVLGAGAGLSAPAAEGGNS